MILEQQYTLPRISRITHPLGGRRAPQKIAAGHHHPHHSDRRDAPKRSAFDN
jgi:hypothetical protein